MKHTLFFLALFCLFSCKDGEGDSTVHIERLIIGEWMQVFPNKPKDSKYECKYEFFKGNSCAKTVIFYFEGEKQVIYECLFYQIVEDGKYIVFTEDYFNFYEWEIIRISKNRLTILTYSGQIEFKRIK